MSAVITPFVHMSKYLLALLMVWFTLESYFALREKNPRQQDAMIFRQLLLIFLLNLVGYLVLLVQDRRTETLLMLGEVLIYLLTVQILYRVIYRKASMLLLNNVCMLLSIGLLILTRLNIGKAQSQFKILAASTLLCFVIPVIVRKARFLTNLHLLYAIVGIGMLAAVLLLALTSRGAKLSISILGYTFQFSELVKITLVLYLASALREDESFKNVALATSVAALHVLILVASTDLGTAFVFFMAYVVVIYLATRKPLYPLLGLGGMSIACVTAYYLFSHVQTRVALWKDPIGNWDISSQLAQALFGLCSGGWFGEGLYQGRPELIPIVEKDFVFDAICEEMGVLFGICLILLCLSTFLLMVNVSMKLSKRFYKLIAMGLAAEYASQVFLTIGGTIKCIPMTGITLPLVSYGGSSILATILMISIIQGLYILREDEGEAYVRLLYKRRRAEYAKQKKEASAKRQIAGQNPADRRSQGSPDPRSDRRRAEKTQSSRDRNQRTTGPQQSGRQNQRTAGSQQSGRQSQRTAGPQSGRQPSDELARRIEKQTEESLKW